MHNGIWWHLSVQFLWDRPWQGSQVLYILSWLLQWRADSFECAFSLLTFLFLFSPFLNFLNQLFIIFSGVGPNGTPGTFLARGSWREGMLEEMVIVIDRNLTEVAHMGTTAARHVVAAFGFDKTGLILGAFSNVSRSHFFFNRCPVLDVILFGQHFTGKDIVLFPESLTLPTSLLQAARIRSAEQIREATRGAPYKQSMK